VEGDLPVREQVAAVAVRPAGAVKAALGGALAQPGIEALARTSEASFGESAEEASDCAPVFEIRDREPRRTPARRAYESSALRAQEPECFRSATASCSCREHPREQTVFLEQTQPASTPTFAGEEEQLQLRCG